MGKKVYAIKEGFDSKKNIRIKNKIVNSWNECLMYVKGVKGAKYKSFENINDANEYLSQDNDMLIKGVDEYPQDALHVYVDGSYNAFTKKYSYALVALKNNIVEYIDSGVEDEDSNCTIRQVAGELKAAELGVRYAISKNEKQVVIIHDYEGIAHHANGTWDRKESSSVRYYETMKDLKKSIKVIFVKVDSHTGDIFNELADEKCKEKVEIKSDKVVENYLSSNTIYVANEEVKKQISSLAIDKEDKIVIKADSEDLKKNESKKTDDIINEIVNILKDMSHSKQERCLEYVKKLKSTM